MSMPNENEQAELSKWEDERRNERITDKIYKAMSAAEERLLKQMAPIQNKVDEHDEKIVEHDGFFQRFRRAFGVSAKR